MGARYKQSLDDTLITLGLLRNLNIDASTSATAYREAVRRMASEEHAQNAIKSAGVEIYDRYSLKMRSIIEIMQDFAEKTRNLTDEERNRRLNIAFGSEASAAYAAITGATFKTIKDGTEIVYEGARAIAAMREEMANSQGSAARAREAYLDNFAGQKQLLTGVLESLAIVVGEPFAAVFKPLVGGISKAIEGLTYFVNVLPAGLKRFAAGALVGAAAFAGLIGLIAVGSAAASLCSIAMTVLGVSVASVTAALLPAVGIAVAVAAAATLLYVAFSNNLGGIADFAESIADKVMLYFTALKEWLKSGSLSEGVFLALTGSDNTGVLAFFSATATVIHYVSEKAKRLAEVFSAFWNAFSEGFGAEFANFAPALTLLGKAAMLVVDQFRRLVVALFRTGGALPLQQFQTFGKIVGHVLGFAIGLATAMASVVASAFFGVQAGVVALFSMAISAERWLVRAFMSLPSAVISAFGTAVAFIGNVWDKATDYTRRFVSETLELGGAKK